jgi:hypothetical protein
LERSSLRAGDIRRHRKKHQSQVQTSKILNSLSPIYPSSFRPYPFEKLILYPFAFIPFKGEIRARLFAFFPLSALIIHSCSLVVWSLKR